MGDNTRGELRVSIPMYRFMDRVLESSLDISGARLQIHTGGKHRAVVRIIRLRKSPDGEVVVDYRHVSHDDHTSVPWRLRSTSIAKIKAITQTIRYLIIHVELSN